MSAVTGIEWTDRTWNPTTGCDKVSPGCKNCYAETIAKRLWPTSYPAVPTKFVRSGEKVYANISGPTRPREFTDVQTHEDRLLEPLSWRKPSKVFVNSMSDLFHEDVPFEFIAAVFGVMAHVERHTFQILTKRPERMLEWFRWIEHQLPSRHTFGAARGVRWYAWSRDPSGCSSVRPIWNPSEGPPDWRWPLPNVWLGVSVENQHFADERIPLLRQTPAAVRFLSIEPQLEAIDLRPWLFDSTDATNDYRCINCGEHVRFVSQAVTCGCGTESCDVEPIDWVIVGGESGPGARPFDLAWARSIVQQCKAAGVACFVKQVGAVPTMNCGQCGRTVGRVMGGFVDACGPAHAALIAEFVRIGDRKGGDPSEWPEDIRIRQFPAVEA